MDRTKLSYEEAASLQALWMNVFCNYSRKENAEPHLSEFKWHTFSSGRFPSLHGSEAVEAYTIQKAYRYIVLPECVPKITSCLGLPVFIE